MASVCQGTLTLPRAGGAFLCPLNREISPWPGAAECEKDVMSYRVVLILKSGERVADDARMSPRCTPEIGEVIEIFIDTRVLRARVKGIAKTPTDRPDPEERMDLVIAREI